MNKLKSFSQLKSAARGHLNGNYNTCVIIVLLYVSISSIVLMLTSGAGSGATPVVAVISLLISIICASVMSVFKAGLFHFFIKLCCKSDYNVRDVFCGWQINPKRNFIYMFIIQVIENLCLAPFCYLAIMADNINDLPAVLLSLIIGFSIFFVLWINLSQVVFLLFDFPDKSIKELVNLSFWLMKGQRLRYFLLVISFLPLEILGLISCGLGLLWVRPYKYATYACFYLDLTKNKTE